MNVLQAAPLADPAALTADRGAAVWWLGQAGFLIAQGGLRIVIDAYLSDSLAEKYRGKAFPHNRMMPPPVAPDALTGIDWLTAPLLACVMLPVDVPAAGRTRRT